MMSTAIATATSSSAAAASVSPPMISNSTEATDAKENPLDLNVKPSSTRQRDENNSDLGDPLPAELRRILSEVARVGRCNGLTWDNTSQTTTDGSADTSKGVRRRRSGSNVASSLCNPRSSPPLHMVPVRKKRRNGMYNMSRSRRRYEASSTKTSNSTTTASSSITTTTRKRPLFLIRTSTASKACSTTGSVGSSGRTSGSEQEGDSTQYECDSEGTSATTNSEVSFERREQHLRGTTNSRIAIHSSAVAASLHAKQANAGSDKTNSPRYSSLREAIRVALELVLEHAYKYRGGYKMSPAELRRDATEKGQQDTVEQTQPEKDVAENANDRNETDSIVLSSTSLIATAEIIFQRRCKRLLGLLGQNKIESVDVGVKTAHGLQSTTAIDETPFTIQRIAEVLLSPQKYYTQTHKLCNALEKLLLVTSSSDSFGGIHGGDSSQSRQEERELAALANEKGRERRLRRRPSSTDDVFIDSHDLHALSGASQMEAESNSDSEKAPLSPGKLKSDTGEDSAVDHSHVASHSPQHVSRESLEAAARASLRSKFDHVAIDAHAASASVERESGVRPSSPPPPSIGFVRQHLQEHGAGESYADPMGHSHHMIARPPSPILFGPGTTDSASAASASATAINPLSPNRSVQLLQMHHAPSLASLNGTPLEMVIDPIASSPSTATANVAALLEADPTGRSSASNSDVDSESDDISLDDSASDRSDGSDSGSGTAHHEPFTAARVMALNRMQQQQQRLQSRVLAALNSTGTSGSHIHYSQEGYQSSDSIDSMMAEDSGGSDSSSSDIAD